MTIAFPVPQHEQTASSMLEMLLEHGHIDEHDVFSVHLEPWQIDLLSSYGAADADLEDSDDDDDEAFSR